MTVRDTITRTRARAPGAEDHPSSKAVHYQVRGPTQRGNYRSDHEVHEGRRQTGRRPAHAGSRLKLIDVPGRSRLVRQPSSRTGENSPYGMIGGIEETSASFEARSAPRSPALTLSHGLTRARGRCWPGRGLPVATGSLANERGRAKTASGGPALTLSHGLTRARGRC